MAQSVAPSLWEAQISHNIFIVFIIASSEVGPTLFQSEVGPTVFQSEVGSTLFQSEVRSIVFQS
jgi:hypothetical protein